MFVDVGAVVEKARAVGRVKVAAMAIVAVQDKRFHCVE